MMSLLKRQIIEVRDGLNSNPNSKHPFVIISAPEVFDAEGYYLCVMISTTEIRDQFTFELDLKTLSKSL